MTLDKFLPQISYSESWDKLHCEVGVKFTTIRDRFGKYGDKLDYYKPGYKYQQMVLKKPAFIALLNGVETKVGKNIPQWLLEEDTKLKGIPQKEWIDKIRKMRHALILTQKKLTEYKGLIP